MIVFLAWLSAVAAAPAVAAPPAAERPLAPLAMMPSPHAVVPATARHDTAKPGRDQVLAAIRAEWDKYDTRRAGKLGPLEFATWVMRANGLEVAPAGATRASGVKPVTAMNATARAFAAADSDHDGGVTPEEMADFLMR